MGRGPSAETSLSMWHERAEINDLKCSGVFTEMNVICSGLIIEIVLVVRKSGCYPKCRVTKYSFEKIERPMNWNSAWSSEVFVQAASSEVEYSEEYYTFDENDLVSSVGGNMGLFLGWSVLTLVEAIGFLIVVTKVEKYFRKFA